jgi:conjugative transfer pilus assembly protein TraH
LKRGIDMFGKKIGITRKIVACFVMSSLISAQPIAFAGLKDALNGMFASASTSPQAIDTQRLNGIYGGSMTLRSQVKSMNVVQFAPPRISAGCGGVDMFFGSFSFINGAQFEQLLRTIAANAVGYAIEVALKAMCDPCHSIVSKLMDAVRELNSLGKNTCAIANSMLDGSLATKMKEQSRKIGVSLQGAFSLTSDWLSGENSSQASTDSDTSTGGGNPSVTNNNPLYGNLVWRAANDTLNNGGSNTLGAFLSAAEVTEFAMSLFGTVVNKPKSSMDAGSCPTDAAPESCDMPVIPYESIIPAWDKLFDPMRYGPADGTQVYTCNNDDCTDVGRRSISISEWAGVSAAVNLALFGTQDATDRTSWTSDSLIGAYANHVPVGSGTLSTRAKQLVNIVPFPVITMLNEVQYINGAPEMIGNILAQSLPDFFSYQMGVELLGIGQNAFSGQTKTEMPSSYRATLTEKARALSGMRKNATTDMNALIKGVYDSVVTIQKLSAAKIRATNPGNTAR